MSFYDVTYQDALRARRELADRDQAEQDANPCDMCRPYGRPGFIFNAWQWVRCFDCNQEEKTND